MVHLQTAFSFMGWAFGVHNQTLHHPLLMIALTTVMHCWRGSTLVGERTVEINYKIVLER